MKLEEYIENADRMKTIKRIFYIILLLIVLFDIGVHLNLISGNIPEHFFGDKVWGFWAVFGLIGCILLIIICKGIGHAVLMKEEDYYD